MRTPREPRSVCADNVGRLDGAPPREPVADRIAMILRACAGKKRSLTLPELVEETSLAKTTLHRLCWKLAELGLLEHSRDGFAIGAGLVALASASPVVSRLRTVAMPYLLDAHKRTGAIPHLAILNDGRALMLDGLFTHDNRHLQRFLGDALPLHCTATGKAIAARLDPQRREELLFARGRLPAATGGTVVHPALLRRQLRLIAETGIAYADEELVPGVKGVASAFTLPGGGIAAVGVVGTTSSAVLRRGPAVVAAAAAALEQALG